MRADLVLALLRLRSLATREARRVLGLRVQLETAQQMEASLRAAAPLREQAAGGDPLFIAAWMPRALRDAARAKAQAAQASAARDAAQAALAQARKQERILEGLAETRAAAQAMLAMRRDQARIDDRAQARHGAEAPARRGDANEGRHGEPAQVAGELQRVPRQVEPASRSHGHHAEQRTTTP